MNTLLEPPSRFFSSITWQRISLIRAKVCLQTLFIPPHTSLNELPFGKRAGVYVATRKLVRHFVKEAH